MIDAGIDINYQDSYGCAAIHRSAEHGKSEVADLLVNAKAELNVKDNNYRTPFEWAKASGHREDFEEVMRKYGKKVKGDEIVDDGDALFEAVDEGEVLKLNW